MLCCIKRVHYALISVNCIETGKLLYRLVASSFQFFHTKRYGNMLM